MKLAVVTLAIGDFHTRLAEITHPLLKNYADRIGAEFVVLKDSGRWKMPHYRKLDIAELLEKYDRVLYIDTDILVRPDSPNLFDLIPETHVGILNEAQFADRAGMFHAFCESIQYKLTGWDGCYYNTGVFVCSRAHKKMFTPPVIEHDHFFEQSYINLLIHMQKIPVKNLYYRFNRMTCMESVSGESRFASYFMHYAGARYVMPDAALLKQIEHDRDQWQKDSESGFQYKKKICISPSGGLGDVVAAEPAVRYMAEVVYPNEEVVIKSSFPEIFTHIKCTKNIGHNETVERPNEYAIFDSLRTVQYPYFVFVSPLMSHQLTIASHLLLKRELPLQARNMKLPVNPSLVQNFEDKHGSFKKAVIVHPGRHWKSKTFPTEVWQDYIDILTQNKFKVVVIGKDLNAEQGVVKGLDLSGCVDLVGKTSLLEMISILNRALVLISNDSAPVHLAGGTNINIGLIPTVKSPDFILPYRQGSIYHRAKALFRKPLWDSFPSDPLQMYEIMADSCDEKLLRECLPTAEEVLDYCQGCD